MAARTHQHLFQKQPTEQTLFFFDLQKSQSDWLFGGQPLLIEPTKDATVMDRTSLAILTPASFDMCHGGINFTNITQDTGRTSTNRRAEHESLTQGCLSLDKWIWKTNFHGIWQVTSSYIWDQSRKVSVGSSGWAGRPSASVVPRPLEPGCVSHGVQSFLPVWRKREEKQALQKII